MKCIVIVLAFAVAVAPTQALARSVFLNGVDISNVRNQTFKDASVSIDKDGNVRIEAPGYKVEVKDPAPNSGTPTPPPMSKGGPNPSLVKKYYLITQPSNDGRAQYDFAVVVNGVEYKTVKAGAPQVIMEISAWLKKGDNEIEIRAIKDHSTSRKSVSPTDEARLIVGVGHEENKRVKVDSVKASVKVNASLNTNVTKHFVLAAY